MRFLRHFLIVALVSASGGIGAAVLGPARAPAWPPAAPGVIAACIVGITAPDCRTIEDRRARAEQERRWESERRAEAYHRAARAILRAK
jgi:hypothetical protein